MVLILMALAVAGEPARSEWLDHLGSEKQPVPRVRFEHPEPEGLDPARSDGMERVGSEIQPVPRVRFEHPEPGPRPIGEVVAAGDGVVQMPSRLALWYDQRELVARRLEVDLKVAGLELRSLEVRLEAARAELAAEREVSASRLTMAEDWQAYAEDVERRRRRERTAGTLERVGLVLGTAAVVYGSAKAWGALTPH